MPLWQFAWQTVIQLALRFAISHFFEHFSKHACCDFWAKAVCGTKVGIITAAIANVLISSVFMVVSPCYRLSYFLHARVRWHDT